MQAANNTQSISLYIKDISCAGLPRLGARLRQGAFYAVAMVAGVNQRTYVAKRSSTPSWNSVLTFNNIPNNGSLTISVMAQRSMGDDKFVCKLHSPVEIALDIQDTKEFTTQALVDKKKKNRGTIAFTLQVERSGKHPNAQEPPRPLGSQAEENAQRLNEKSAQLQAIAGPVSGAGEALQEIADMYDTWQSLADKIEVVVKVASTIAELHPYGQMVWSIISPALEAISKQIQRDREISNLFYAMDDIYSFVALRSGLQAENISESRREIVKLMLQQTYDCGWFINDYASRGFIRRGVKAATSGHDTIVKSYIDSFGELKAKYQEDASFDAEITIHRTLAIAQKTLNYQVLNDIAFAKGQEIAKECLPGTREGMLADIIEWVHRSPTSSEDDQMVYWLHGVAGCGKSAIASTIARRFQNVGRCVWFFFDASKQAESGPSQMFSTISRNLADLDNKWRESLVKIASKSRQVQTTVNVKEQFENFILKPAEEFEPMGPILVVIDALDESGSREQRLQLLQVLGSLDRLKSHGRFRFLITSRLEEDIRWVFHSKPWILSKSLTGVNEASTANDIRRYVELELLDEHIQIQDWPREQCVDLIVSRAEHLFQWAFVACNFVKGTGEAGVNPARRYAYLRNHRTNAHLEKLDRLYTTVLSGLYGAGENDKVKLFRTIIGRVLSAREPLSLGALTELRSDEEEKHDIRLILSSLGSLLKGVNSQDQPIQALHASFIDFMLDPARSGEFHVRMGSEDEAFATSSLRVMNEQLKFNICDLKSSYIRNRDIPDLQVRVKKNIPEHFSYACRHFADHLKDFKDNSTLRALVKVFLYDKLLFWLEALSLLRDTYPAQIQLLSLQAWIKKHADNEELRIFAEDAERFVRSYSGMMGTSTPHIYLSSLAYIPSSSLLHKRYLGQFPGSVKVAPGIGSPVSWTSMLLEIKTPSTVVLAQYSPDDKYIASGHSDGSIYIWNAHTGQLVAGSLKGHAEIVWSVGFSPDGKYIVSGSDDCTIRVWDVYTAQLVSSPFKGHTGGVTSVVFSPNGEYIASGSRDNSVRVWDVRTGHLSIGPLNGHTDAVWSVAFSPNGKSFLSGSDDMTIRVWDLHTGQLTAGPFEGHSGEIYSVAFSPDGKDIVSGSSDNSVRVWEGQTGQLRIDPLRGHSAPVKSAKFSPDGKHIVSGSDDCTIRLWDARTGQLVAGPLQGHTGEVFSVGFSSNGMYIVSGSLDATIRVWDAHIGQATSHAFQGHTGSVNSTGFSPDGKYIVSGSFDKTIRVWDARTGQLVAGPFEGHADRVRSVVFSPDGKYVVSGSDDCTIRVWDVSTGQLVTDALEGHTSRINSVVFSLDGKYIASGSDDCSIRAWDVCTRQLIIDPLKGHTGRVWSVEFSPDGEYIVSGSSDATVRVWYVHTGQLAASPFEGHTSSVYSVGFSPDGKYIVSGSSDCTIRVWDVSTGQLVTDPFKGHTHCVMSVKFSPDGKYIVSGSLDCTICIWNASTGQLVVDPFKGHNDWVRSVAFSPDGKYIVSSSNDSTIRVWHAPFHSTHHTQTTSSARSSSSLGQPQIPPSRHSPDDESTASQIYTSDQKPTNASRPLHESVCYANHSSWMDDDGWMCGPSGELLFWVPPVYRPNLWKPRNICVIGKDSLKLDLDRFTHGTEWEKCYVEQGGA